MKFLSQSWHWIPSFLVLPLLPESYREKQIPVTPTGLTGFGLKVGNSLGPLEPQLQPLCEQHTHHSSTLTALPTLCNLVVISSPLDILGRSGTLLSTSPQHKAPVQLRRSWGPLPTQLHLGCVLLSICLPPASGCLQDGSSRPFSHWNVIAKEAYVCFQVFSFVFLTPQVFHWF